VIEALGLPPNVTFVPTDFNHEALERVLADTPFDSSKRAVFIWEGVTQYITEEAVRKSLAFVGKSAPGSRVAFTYVLKAVIDGDSHLPGADRMMAEVGRQGSPWIFGLDPRSIGQYLEPFHLALKADVGGADYQALYLVPMNRKLDVPSANESRRRFVR